MGHQRSRVFRWQRSLGPPLLVRRSVLRLLPPASQQICWIALLVVVKLLLMVTAKPDPVGYALSFVFGKSRVVSGAAWARARNVPGDTAVGRPGRSSLRRATCRRPAGGDRAAV